MRLKISNLTDETATIRSFTLVNATEAGPLPDFSAGSHITVKVDDTVWRQYSLANAPGSRDHYLISVLREKESRGGSQGIHDTWKVGDVIEVEGPANNFRLDESADRVILIAGGIGVTPILSMARRLEQIGTDYHMYYCARSVEETAHYDAIVKSSLAGNVTFVHDEGRPDGQLDVTTLLQDRDRGSHVYVCGPLGLVDAVKAASEHWPEGTVHYELFSADPKAQVDARDDTGFSVTLGSTGDKYEVPAGRSIMQVLADNGIEVPKLCEEGFCGSCLTPVLDGTPDHRDTVLTAEEKKAGDMMALCCSRAKSENIVLDL